MSPQLLGFLLALGAGLCTTIGGACVFFLKDFHRLHLAICMAASAGVMSYVSFIEIFGESTENLTTAFAGRNWFQKSHERVAYIISTVCFFAGWIFAILVNIAIQQCITLFRLEEIADRKTPEIELEERREGDLEVPSSSVINNRTRKTRRSASIDNRQFQPSSLPDVSNINTISTTIEDVQKKVNSNSCEIVGENTQVLDGRRSFRCADILNKLCCRKSRTERSTSFLLESQHAEECFKRDSAKFLKVGTITAVVLALHNLPEGIATFTSNLGSGNSGIVIALAIGIHNIPEGFAVSVPLYFGTGNRLSSFGFSCISGLAEPLGALLAWAALRNNQDPLILGIAFGIVGGIMTNIALIEMLPTAIKYDPCDQVTSISFLTGMMIMAVSLILLGS